MLRKTKTVLAIFSVLAIFTACGKINPVEIKQKAIKFRYVIALTVDIGWVTPDPLIFIRTNEFEINEDTHSIIVKGPSLMDSEGYLGSYAIKFDGMVTFSFPSGGRLHVRDLQTQNEIILEQYGDLKTKQEQGKKKN